MTDSWTNSKGVKFIGDELTVPAPDYKGAEVVDYKEWRERETEIALNLSLEVTSTGIISEAAATVPQTAVVTARMLNEGSTYAEWAHGYLFEIVGDDIGDTTLGTKVDGAVSTQEVIFSANVVEGNTVTVQVTADDTENTYVETIVLTVVA